MLRAGCEQLGSTQATQQYKEARAELLRELIRIQVYISSHQPRVITSRSIHPRQRHAAGTSPAGDGASFIRAPIRI